jgi:hypothetical protein
MVLRAGPPMPSLASREGFRLFTDAGGAAGGAFGSDAATGMMPAAHRVAGVLTSLAVVIHRQEVRPMNAGSAVGAPLQSTIARLR